MRYRLFIFIFISSLFLYAPSVHAEKIIHVQAYKNANSFIYQKFKEYVIEPINKDLHGTLYMNLIERKETSSHFKKNEDIFVGAQQGEKIQAFLSTPQYWAHINPVFSMIGDMIAAWPSTAVFIEWYETAGGKEIMQKLYHQHNLHQISYTLNSAESLVSLTPIPDLKSLYGKMIRAPERSMAFSFFKALGAYPRPIQLLNVNNAFKAERISIADYGALYSNYKAGLYEIAKHTNYPGFHSRPLLDFVMNKDVWEKISDEDRKVIEKHAQAWRDGFIYDAEAYQEKLYQELQLEGDVHFYQWEESEINKAREIAHNVWKEFALKSPESYELVKNMTTWLIQKKYLSEKILK